MIDWSSSDYTNNDHDLFYISSPDSSVYLNNRYDLNNHLCYQCEPGKEPSSSINETVVIPEAASEDENFTQPATLQDQIDELKKIINNFKPEIKKDTSVPIQNKSSFQSTPLQISSPFQSNFISAISSNNILIIIFFAILLFLIYVELRVSNIYKKYN